MGAVVDKGVTAIKVGTIAAAVIALLMALVEPAAAHAAYSDSDPADEETVSSPPSEVWAEFTEPPAGGSNLKIYDECGTKVDNGDSRLEAFRIYITMSSAASGTYRVDFRVLSAYDNHVTTGSFTFTSTGGENCAGEEEEPAAGEDEGGASGGDDGSAGSQDGSGSDGNDGGSNSGGSGGGGGGAGGNGGGGGRDGGGGDGGSAGDDDGIDLARDSERPEKGLMEGIEWGEFAFALAIAAVIGGAGGKVYAGIVGPRR